MSKATPENHIKKEIKNWLGYHGWQHFPILQGLGCYPGLPDLIAFHAGVVLFIEVKTAKGKQSPNQKKFEDMVKSQNCHYVLARGFEDIKNYIKQIKGNGK